MSEVLMINFNNLSFDYSNSFEAKDSYPRYI